MPGSSDLLVLRASRSKWLLVLVGSLIFVAVGMWMWRQERAWLALLSLGFFGACAIVAVVQVLLPGRLTLDAQGMHVTQFGRRWGDFEWQHCDGFRPWSYGTASAVVVFDYTGPSRRWHGRVARASVRLSGSNAGLPDTFGLPAAELASLLHQRKAGAEDGRRSV